jgi:hypothetical protein
MALDYNGSAALMNDITFRGRVKVACLKFATSIAEEAPTIAAHNTRFKWAQQCMNNPDMTAGTVTPPAVMDPAVQLNGSNIIDSDLQAAVEAAIQNFM